MDIDQVKKDSNDPSLEEAPFGANVAGATVMRYTGD